MIFDGLYEELTINDKTIKISDRRNLPKYFILIQDQDH